MNFFKRCKVCGEEIHGKKNVLSFRECPVCHSKVFDYVPIQERKVAVPIGTKAVSQSAQKVLGDLYAVRATMSLVAKNDSDHAGPEKKEILQIRRAIDEKNREIESIKRGEADRLEKFSYEYKIKDLEEDIKALKGKKGKIEQSYHEDQKRCGEVFFQSWSYFKSWKKFLPLTVFFIIFAILQTSLFFGVLGPQIGIGPTWALAFSLPFAEFLTIHMIYFSIKNAQSNRIFSRYQKSVKPIDDCIKSLQKKIEEYKERIEHGQLYVDMPEFHEEKGKTESAIAACAQSIQELKEQIPPHQMVIKAVAESSQVIVNSAIAAYPIIDYRDWENVDLLIYYFETGRADDIKEALQLVDRQKQTDQITSALAMASAAICKTIQSSIQRLGDVLAQSFVALSRQMEAQHSEMMYGLEKQTEAQRAASEAQIREIQAQTAAQASAQAMNQALLEKISVSSSELAKQIDRQMTEVYNLY